MSGLNNTCVGLLHNPTLLSCAVRFPFLSAVSRGLSPLVSSTPSIFSLAKEDESAVPDVSSSHAFQSSANASEEVSAAEFDAAADQKAEDVRRIQHETSKVSNTAAVPTNPEETVEVVLASEAGDDDDDDDDDDMFSSVLKPKKIKVAAAHAVPVR